MRSILRSLPAAFRRRGLRIAATLVLRAVLNLAGLAALLPVLTLVLDPAGFEGDGPLATVYVWSGVASPRTFALAVCGAVVGFIVLKCGVNFLLARAERRYIYDLYRTLSRRLYIAYHDRGLAFINNSNSSVLARNVNVVCLAFAAGVLRPAAAMIAEAMLFVLLFASLALYTPLAALLSVVIFLPAVWLYYALVRNRINRYGEQENRAQREKSRLVAETFRGYADIELSDAFPGMLRAFDRTMDEVVRTRSREADIGQLPQLFTEIGLAVGMALLAAVSFGGGQSQLLFGVFAVAALRLMPSVRGIMSGWATIRYNRYTIPILREAALHEPASAHPGVPTRETLPFEREISVRNLSFRFTCRGEKYVYRHPGVGTDAYINRRSEASSMEAARRLGLDDTYIYMDEAEGWKLSRYIEDARTLDYHDEQQVTQALAMLRRLHESGEQTAYPFDAWGEIQGFEESLRRFNRADFEDMQQMRDGIARLRAHLEADGTPVRLCHCDSYAPNFLLDRADKMYLIDWEYSGMSDPAWDIGTFIACADYTMDEADGIIRRYMGREPSREELRHHLGYVAVASFYWFLWALYQDCVGKSVGSYLYIWYRYTKSYSARALALYEDGQSEKETNA